MSDDFVCQSVALARPGLGDLSPYLELGLKLVKYTHHEEAHRLRRPRCAEWLNRYVAEAAPMGPHLPEPFKTPEAVAELDAGRGIAVADLAPQTLAIGDGFPIDLLPSAWASFRRRPRNWLRTVERASDRSVGLKVGRNDPCPCGSGKKPKKCHTA